MNVFMKIDLKEDVISLTEFARNTREHAQALAKGERVRVLTQNGKAAAVLLSLDSYEKLTHDAEEHRMDLRLRAALEAYAKGDRGKPAATVFRRLRQKLHKQSTKA
jgi:PHD/YefM family antitoxin component YafN of YafNO toxin-antitoxin module